MILSERCTRCGEEVRTVVDSGKWSHREAADHEPMFGNATTREVYDNAIQVWWDRQSEDAEEKSEEIAVPDPEVRAMPVDLTGKRLFVITADGGVALCQLPGGAKTVVNMARKTGWEISASYSRGPWLHASSWAPTGIGDHVVVRFRRGPQRAVATWRNSAFETAWTWGPGSDSLELVNSKQLRAHIKEEVQP